MSWSNSTRRERLPSDWSKIRRRVLRRDDHMCQWELPDGSLCFDVATDVDHIERGDDHRDHNLRSLCRMHHARKSAREGAEAYWAKRRETAQRFQRNEQHPGLL